MRDYPTNRGQADRSRDAAEQPYRAADFARKHAISLEEAQTAILIAGPSRANCDAMIARHKEKRADRS